MSRNEELIRDGMSNQHPIYAVYKGYRRWLCPHVLGYKGGRLHVLAYQYEGESSSGPIATPTDPTNGPSEYWRCIDVDQMTEVEVIASGPWYTCQRHTQRQTCVDRVLAEVNH